MSHYTHAYSEYVNHILNNSPSKTTYSFAKTQRFPKSRTQVMEQQQCIQANNHEYRDGEYYKYKMGILNRQPEREPQRKKKQTLEVFAVRREVQKTLREMERYRKNTTKSKSKSPISKFGRLNQNKLNYQNADPKSKYSPLKKISNDSWYSPKNQSPQRSPNKIKQPSPIQTYNKYLNQIDHPLKNMTVGGYYPTGTELSPTGRYIDSRIRNTPGHTFGKSPSKLRFEDPIKKSDTLGPGYYDKFSEFGPIHNK